MWYFNLRINNNLKFYKSVMLCWYYILIKIKYVHILSNFINYFKILIGFILKIYILINIVNHDINNLDCSKIIDLIFNR